jgi:hypothetical protein
MILKWVLKNELKGVDLINLTQVAGCCGRGNEPCVFHNELYDDVQILASGVTR